MSHLPPEKIINNEEGFVLVAAMMVLAVLLLIGISATKSTNIEQQVSANDRLEKQEFFNQETCLARSKINANIWLTTTFVTAGETTAFFPQAGQDIDLNGIPDTTDSMIRDANNIVIATFKARSMESTGTAIAGLAPAGSTPAQVAAEPANSFPPMSHTDKPPPGSGYSPTTFEVRRFIVTCESPNTDRNSVLQEGVFKVFNKF